MFTTGDRSARRHRPVGQVRLDLRRRRGLRCLLGRRCRRVLPCRRRLARLAELARLSSPGCHWWRRRREKEKGQNLCIYSRRKRELGPALRR
jgi:hypothetical protein